MNAKEYLAIEATKADKYLNSFFAKKRREAAKIDPLAVDVLQSLEAYIEGGKKVRVVLTALGYKIAGGADTSKILPAAVAVEIMHNALIIHDDLIDNDTFRRGKPTIHSKYAKHHGEHFGVSIAVVIGDLAIFLSNQLMASTSFDSSKAMKALREFDKFLINTGYGEFLDIAFDYKKNVTWEDIKKIRIYKTAHYTFVSPLVVGAILGGASKKVLEALESYGENVGLAFQIRDDVLGVFGNTAKTGKSNEGDIREGKRTLLYIKALELAGKKEKEYLKKWYGKAGLSRAKIDKIRSIIANSGSLEYSEKLAKSFVKEGKNNISKITSNKRITIVLSGLADYMVTRDK